MWLAAFVLPLQGTAVGVISALRPARIHCRAEAPLFVGDAGEAEPSRAGLRPQLDADVAVSRAHFTAPDLANPTDPTDPLRGDHISGSIQTVVSVGVTVAELGS